MPSGTPISMAKATATIMIDSVTIVRSQKPHSPTANIDAAAIVAVRQPARKYPITNVKATTPVQCNNRRNVRPRFWHQVMPVPIDLIASSNQLRPVFWVIQWYTD